MKTSVAKFIEKLVWDDNLYGRSILGRLVALTLRYSFAVFRDVLSGQLTMRAMSLVYTTLLSVVPLLAFSFAILKGFGVFKQLEPFLERLLDPLGEQGVQITEQILELVNNVQGSVLGGIGLVFFVYTAISTVQKVEESFNYVWYVSKPRSFARRFSEYFIVLMVGPMVMVTAIGMITSIQSNTVVQFLITNDQLGPVFVLIGKFVPYLLISGVFTFLYVFMPNTKVNLRSALVGGIAGGFMWATMSALFTTFILYSTRTLQIYAGFAVAIMALFWLYLNWLILLVGAQLAFYHQRPAFLRIGRREPRLSNSVRERLALNIMYLVGKSFREPDSVITFAQISKQLSIPSIALSSVADGLEAAGLLLSTEREELLPGREMSRILLRDILDVVRSTGETGSDRPPNWTGGIDRIGGQLERAVSDITVDRTLSDILDELANDDEAIERES